MGRLDIIKIAILLQLIIGHVNGQGFFRTHRSVVSNPCTLVLGDPYGGGIIGYILQPGDPGYDAGTCHGLIVGANLGTAEWGCQGTSITTTDGLGYGLTNTNAIIAACGTAGIAAKMAKNCTQGGYTDWYLPSQYEMSKTPSLYGGGATYDGLLYWTSTQVDANQAWAFIGYASSQQNKGYTDLYVRPFRSF